MATVATHMRTYSVGGGVPLPLYTFNMYRTCTEKENKMQVALKKKKKAVKTVDKKRPKCAQWLAVILWL